MDMNEFLPDWTEIDIVGTYNDNETNKSKEMMNEMILSEMWWE